MQNIPELLVEVGYFDTSPNFSGGGFYGNWGAYPYFESDLIICSDIEEGLWVLEPTYVEASRLHVVVYDSITKAPMSNVNISFDKLGKVVESNIDGLADIGTPLQVQDSLIVSMPGFVTHRQQYQWHRRDFRYSQSGFAQCQQCWHRRRSRSTYCDSAES
jgi:hypothetical protein